MDENIENSGEESSNDLILNLDFQGVKLNFFPDSHLAPKSFKVVANSKKVGHHFQRQIKSFFTLSAF